MRSYPNPMGEQREQRAEITRFKKLPWGAMEGRVPNITQELAKRKSGKESQKM